MDRLPSDELARILTASRRCKVSELLLLRVAIHGDEKTVKEAIRTLEGRNSAAPSAEPKPEDDHADFVKGIQKILGAAGKRR